MGSGVSPTSVGRPSPAVKQRQIPGSTLQFWTDDHKPLILPLKHNQLTSKMLRCSLCWNPKDVPSISFIVDTCNSVLIISLDKGG